MMEDVVKRLRDMFDPGGNLPDDCSEWAAAHAQALDELEALVRSGDALQAAPASPPLEEKEHESLVGFHGPYGTREEILHRRCQRAESDVARLQARERAAQDRLDELAKLYEHAIASRERNDLRARQAEAELAALRAAPGATPAPHPIDVQELAARLEGYADRSNVSELNVDLRAASNLLRRLAVAGREPQGWMVVRKRETEPPEVWAFDRYDEAAMFWDRAQTQWSEVYFCRIAYGPSRDEMVGERPALPAPPGAAQPEFVPQTSEQLRARAKECEQKNMPFWARHLRDLADSQDLKEARTGAVTPSTQEKP